jgi:uncharacterized membrane protein
VTKYDWLLLVHILGAFLFLSGSIVAGVLALAAMQRERPSEIALLLRLVRPAVIVVGVGSLVALGLGIWLAEYVGYGLGRAWVVAAIVLWAASGALAGPAGKTMYTRARSPSVSPRTATGRASSSASPSATRARSR